MIDFDRLPPGTTCDECGAIVTAKEIEHPEPVPLGSGATYIPCDFYSYNRPCGHLAGATWTEDETEGMPLP